MSRSRRKHPFIGWAKADSEKKDKRLANRSLRKRVNQMLTAETVEYLEENADLCLRDVSGVYWFSKDGKQRIDQNSDLMRK